MENWYISLGGFACSEIYGEVDMSDSSGGERCLAGVTNETRELGWVDHHLVKTRYIVKELDEIYLLKVITPEESGVLLSGDGEDWCVVHLGVVEAVEEMDCT